MEGDGARWESVGHLMTPQHWCLESRRSQLAGTGVSFPHASCPTAPSERVMGKSDHQRSSGRDRGKDSPQAALDQGDGVDILGWEGQVGLGVHLNWGH